MRVGSDALFKELMMAGAGPYSATGPDRCSTSSRRSCPADGTAGCGQPRVYKSDTLTLTYIPNSYSQTSISQTMPPQSAELKVTYPPNCQVPRDLCGFEVGMTVLIFDDTGHFDTFTLTQVQNDAAHVQHRGQGLTYSYNAGSTITQAVSNTYYRNAATNQLMVYDGSQDRDPDRRQRRGPPLRVFRRSASRLRPIRAWPGAQLPL